MNLNIFNMTQETCDKRKVLTKEFDSFSGFPGESTRCIIERYIHLVNSMSEVGLTKASEE